MATSTAKQKPRLVASLIAYPGVEARSSWEDESRVNIVNRFVRLDGNLRVRLEIEYQDPAFLRKSRNRPRTVFTLPVKSRLIGAVVSDLAVSLPVSTEGTMYLRGRLRGNTYTEALLPRMDMLSESVKNPVLALSEETEAYFGEIFAALSQWGALAFTASAAAADDLVKGRLLRALTESKASATRFSASVVSKEPAFIVPYPICDFDANPDLLSAVAGLPADPHHPVPKVGTPAAPLKAAGTIELGPREEGWRPLHEMPIVGVPEGVNVFGFKQPFTVW